MSTTSAERGNALAFALTALIAVCAGVGMSFQGEANGSLAGVLGHGIFAATVSFVVGFLILAAIVLAVPAGRAAVALEWRLVRSGRFPWWMLLGGIGGSTIVIAQSLTIPLFGVSLFTLSFLSGQLVGALVVDNTSLPPGGRKRMSPNRVVGVLVVMAGVVLSSAGTLAGGIALWAPLLPFIAGVLTGFQQAFNGRLKAATNSAIAATTTNFAVGSAFLVLCSLVVFIFITPVTCVPQHWGQWWMFTGGALGVIYIGVSTTAVARLGVLILSMSTLLGNLLGALLIDVIAGRSEHALAPANLVAMGIVVVGSVVAALPARSRSAREVVTG